MAFLWIIGAIVLIAFLVLTIQLLKRYGRNYVTRHPRNLSGMPPEMKGTRSDSRG
jgi:hypothetical protein